jgi:peptidoglycan hydrolase CwlO-like protein
MCGNRVDELEEQVQELQATVDGLTDELVECKVRIRELENAVDDGNDFEPDRSEADAGTSPAEDTEPADKSNTEAPEDTDEETETDDGSDIIIA